jgi:hypothetical protein
MMMDVIFFGGDLLGRQVRHLKHVNQNRHRYNSHHHWNTLESTATILSASVNSLSRRQR